MRYLSRKEMSLVDKLAMGKYNVDILQMMENAGRSMASFVRNLKPKKVIVIYGKGNNGANGLVAARYLKIYGIPVEIIPASNSGNKMIKHQLKTLKFQSITPKTSFSAGKKDIIIDSLLGYNIEGNPKGRYAELIKKANSSEAQIVSFDLPSGIDPDTGDFYNPYIKANYTLTLALPKTGLKKLRNLYLVNLGIPNELYKELKIDIKKLFDKGDVFKIK